MHNPYDFYAFIQDSIGLPYLELIAKAEEQAAWAESMTRGGRYGAPKARSDGANQYASELKAFLWYLRTGSKPGNRSFQMYRPIVQALVNSGEFKPEALDEFISSSSS